MSDIIKITPETNMLWVFRLPRVYPNQHCFQGGHAVEFVNVDWFRPVEIDDTIMMCRDSWQERVKILSAFINNKSYAQKYLLDAHLAITGFGESFVVECSGGKLI